MSYTPKQQGSGGSGGQSSQQAKTLAGITQQMQNLVHGQNALPQAAQAGLGAFANLNMTLQQQQQQQRFESIIKQQQQLLFTTNPQFQQHFQQQMQQNAAKEPLALTRTPAELINKIQQHQQQANGSASATSLANNLTNQQLQQQLQAFSPNPANLMQQLQAYQYQMQQQQNQQKMLTLNQAQQSLSTLQAQTVAQQHMQQIQQTLQQQQKLIASHKNMASTNQMKSSPASNPQATATQPIQSNNNVANKPAVKTGSAVSNQQQKQIGALQNLAKTMSNVSKTVIPSTAAQKTSLSPQLANKSPSPKMQVNAVPLTKPANKPQTPPIKTTTATSQSPLKAGLLPSSPPKPAVTSTAGLKANKSENTAKPTTAAVSGTVHATPPTTATTVASPTKASTSPVIASQAAMHPEETPTTQVTSTTPPTASLTTTASTSPATTRVTASITTTTAAHTALDESNSTEPTISNEDESAKNSSDKKEDEKKDETEPINAEKDKQEEKVSQPEEKNKEKVVQETTEKSPTKIEETVTESTPEKPITLETTLQDDTPETSPVKHEPTGVPTTPKTAPKLKSVLRKIPPKGESATVAEAHVAEQSTLAEKRKGTAVRECVMPEKVPKASSVEAQDSSEERRSKRHRLKTIPYQSPLPELAFFAKLSATEALGLPKNQEDKLTIFYKNEYLAVRNADGGFFLCQAMQNVYKTSPRIRIQWLSEEKKDSSTYIPDFYDNTDIECVLTTVEMEKVNKSSLSLPPAERSRIENILRKAIDVEKGILPRPNVTEENPDGLDISLYKNESQIEKKTPGRKRKASALNSRKKIASKPKLMKKKKKSKARKKRDSSDSNDESEEENDDKEYKPSRKKAVLTQPMARVQRSPLARARAASPITIRKELPPRARKLVPQKSLTATKSEEVNEVASSISSTSGSSRGDRAKRRGTEHITGEVEETVPKKPVASNQNKKTETKPIARAKTSKSEDDQIPVEDSFKVVQLAETEETGTKNNTTKPEAVETPPARNAKAGSTSTVGTKKNKTSAPSGSASGATSQVAPGGRTTRFRK